MSCLRTSMQLAPLIHFLNPLLTNSPRSVFDSQPGKYGRACKMSCLRGRAYSTRRTIQLPVTLDPHHQTLGRCHHTTLHRVSSKLALLQTGSHLYGSTNGTLRQYQIPWFHGRRLFLATPIRRPRNTGRFPTSYTRTPTSALFCTTTPGGGWVASHRLQTGH